MSWNYANLSRTAKLYGGPEQLIKAVELNGIELGRIAEQTLRLPLLIVAAGGGVLVGAGAVIIIQRVLHNRESEVEKDLELSKQNLRENISEHRRTIYVDGKLERIP